VATHYYPIYLNLAERPCVVIGGGVIAEGKIKALLEAGAQVTLVSPELTSWLKALVDEGQIGYIARGYEPGDLEGAFLAISATDERAVNEQVWAEANRLNIMVNVVDDTPHCNFIAASIMRRGDLAIAISTSGSAPALAVRLRERLEREIGEEYARFLEIAAKLRAPLLARFPGFEERKARWYELVDSDALDLLRHGNEEAALVRIEEIMGVAPAAERGA
jgi:precorrin-2 dehydrogenase / sirohydrochlorin ferrochelatase